MKYVIVGGNAAGMSFAAKMRRNQPDSEIVVLEKKDYVSFGACGLPYYVSDYVKEVDELIVRKVEKFQEQNIDLRILEEVQDIDFINKKVSIRNKTRDYFETYDKLIISSGAAPIVLDGVDVDSKKVFTFTSKDDGEKLKEVIVNNPNKTYGIIGSGFIGLELLDSLYEYKCKTELITLDKYIMEKLYDAEIVQDIETDINKIDTINMHMNSKIESINVGNRVNIVTDTEEIDVDYLIFAIGFKPNSSFVQVDKLGNGAIIVDENMQTTEKDVYAIGDVATVNNLISNKPMYSPLATSANKAGRSLADELSGIETPFKGMLGASILKILDYELGRVGLLQSELDKYGYKYKSKIVSDYNQTSHYKGQEKIVAKIYYEEDTLQILGIEMVGKKGVHGRLDAMSVVISQKITTKELGYVDFAYAPPFSRTWDFLNVIGNVSK